MQKVGTQCKDVCIVLCVCAIIFGQNVLFLEGYGQFPALFGFLLRCGPGAYIIWQPKYQAREVGKLLLGGSSLFGGDIILGGSSCCVKQLVQGIQTRFQKHIKFRGIFFKFERAKQRSPPLARLWTVKHYTPTEMIWISWKTPFLERQFSSFTSQPVTALSPQSPASAPAPAGTPST